MANPKGEREEFGTSRLVYRKGASFAASGRESGVFFMTADDANISETSLGQGNAYVQATGTITFGLAGARAIALHQEQAI